MRSNAGVHNRPVLIVSTKVDVATDAVTRILGERRVPFIRFNTEDFPYRKLASFSLNSTVNQAHLKFQDSSGPFRSIWWRRIRAPENLEQMKRGVHEYCVREAKDFVAGAALASHCRMMSDPSKVWVAEHKLYQLTVAKSCGLEIPNTVATNNAVEIRRAFDSFGGEMIAKPVRTGYVDLGEEQRAIFTTKLSRENLHDLSDAKFSPVIFQEWVPKNRDVRITVVGDQIFAAAIDPHSDPAALVDWRQTEDPDLPHATLDLPGPLESRVRLLMHRLGLTFGALDFVLTPDGRYVFLEVNPSGQWMWIDDRLDLGITTAVADWLSADE